MFSRCTWMRQLIGKATQRRVYSKYEIIEIAWIQWSKLHLYIFSRRHFNILSIFSVSLSLRIALCGLIKYNMNNISRLNAQKSNQHFVAGAWLPGSLIDSCIRFMHMNSVYTNILLYSLCAWYFGCILRFTDVCSQFLFRFISKGTHTRMEYDGTKAHRCNHAGCQCKHTIKKQRQRQQQQRPLDWIRIHYIYMQNSKFHSQNECVACDDGLHTKNARATRRNGEDSISPKSWTMKNKQFRAETTKRTKC